MSLLLLAYVVLLFAVGSFCLLFPRSIQALASKAVTMGITGKYPALKSYIASNSYLVLVRAVGLVAYAMVALLVFSLHEASVK